MILYSGIQKVFKNQIQNYTRKEKDTMKKWYILSFLVIGLTALAYGWLKDTQQREKEINESKEVTVELIPYEERESADCYVKLADSKNLVVITPICEEHTKSQLLMERLGIERIHVSKVTGNVDGIERYLDEGEGFLYLNVSE